MDLESILRWEDYSRAKDQMLVHTDIPEAPWWIVESDDKRRARLNMIAHLLSAVPWSKCPTDDQDPQAALVQGLRASTEGRADLRPRPLGHPGLSRDSSRLRPCGVRLLALRLMVDDDREG